MTGNTTEQLLDRQRSLIDEVISQAATLEQGEMLVLTGIFVTHTLLGLKRIVEWSGEKTSHQLVPADADLHELLERASVAAEATGAFISAIPRATIEGMHPVHRAAYLDMWLKWLEIWAGDFRAARNGEMLAALDDLTPRSVATRLGMSKTYVLRVRDGYSHGT